MAFTPDGKLLIISDDRQMQDLAEDFSVNLGKLIRINLDGNVPANNPFRIAANWRKAPGPWGTAIS
jgi:glucose/arabinose dehydrogenase